MDGSRNAFPEKGASTQRDPRPYRQLAAARDFTDVAVQNVPPNSQAGRRGSHEESLWNSSKVGRMNAGMGWDEALESPMHGNGEA